MVQYYCDSQHRSHITTVCLQLKNHLSHFSLLLYCAYTVCLQVYCVATQFILHVCLPSLFNLKSICWCTVSERTALSYGLFSFYWLKKAKSDSQRASFHHPVMFSSVTSDLGNKTCVLTGEKTIHHAVLWSTQGQGLLAVSFLLNWFVKWQHVTNIKVTSYL